MSKRDKMKTLAAGAGDLQGLKAIDDLMGIDLPKDLAASQGQVEEQAKKNAAAVKTAQARLAPQFPVFAERTWKVLELPREERQFMAEELRKLDEFLEGAVNNKALGAWARAEVALALIKACPALIEDGEVKGAKPHLVRLSGDRVPPENRRSLLDYLVVRIGVAEVTIDEKQPNVVKAWRLRLRVKGERAREIASVLRALIEEVRERATAHFEEELEEALKLAPGYTIVRLQAGEPVDEAGFQLPQKKVVRERGGEKSVWQCPGGAIVVHSEDGVILPVRGVGNVDRDIQQMVDADVQINASEVSSTAQIKLSEDYLRSQGGEQERKRAIFLHYRFRELIGLAGEYEQDRAVLSSEKQLSQQHCEAELARLAANVTGTAEGFYALKPGRAVLDFGRGMFKHDQKDEKGNVRTIGIFRPILDAEITEGREFILHGYRAQFTGGKRVYDPGLDDLIGEYRGQRLPAGEEFRDLQSKAPVLGRMVRAIHSRIRWADKAQVPAPSVGEADKAGKYAAEAAAGAEFVADQGDAVEADGAAPAEA